MGEVVLIHGEEDESVNVEHSLRFYERMKEIGGECQLHLLSQTGHAFLLAEYTANGNACRRGIRIIEECVGVRRRN